MKKLLFCRQKNTYSKNKKVKLKKIVDALIKKITSLKNWHLILNGYHSICRKHANIPQLSILPFKTLIERIYFFENLKVYQNDKKYFHFENVL